MVSAQERFFVVSDVLTDDTKMVILTDFHYWADNEDSLRKWCKETNTQFAGMTLVFPDERTLTAFVLKWQ
jgi:hypothetical protein